MGETEMLANNKISWGSNEHFKKIDEIMEYISYNTILASSNLAIEKGSYLLLMVQIGAKVLCLMITLHKL